MRELERGELTVTEPPSPGEVRDCGAQQRPKRGPENPAELGIGGEGECIEHSPAFPTPRSVSLPLNRLVRNFRY